jgi:hypothetical protein
VVLTSSMASSDRTRRRMAAGYHERATRQAGKSLCRKHLLRIVHVVSSLSWAGLASGARQRRRRQ